MCDKTTNIKCLPLGKILRLVLFSDPTNATIPRFAQSLFFPFYFLSALFCCWILVSPGAMTRQLLIRVIVMSWSDTALMRFDSCCIFFSVWDRNSWRMVFYARPRFRVPGVTFALYLFTLIVVYGASIGIANKSWSIEIWEMLARSWN